jgi:hypothetical protein
MGVHSKLMSPSKGVIWVEGGCTAMPQAALDSGFVDHGSEAAERGTLQHHYAELVAKGEYDVSNGCPHDLVEDGNTNEWTEVLDAVRQLEETVPLNGRKSKVWYEKAVAFQEPWRKDCFGTSDIVVLNTANKTLYIYDYKFGRGAVSINKNPQLSIYGLATIETLKAKKPDIEKYIERVELGIIQPKLHKKPSRWNLLLTDLRRWEQETLIPAQEAVTSGETEFKAGNHCSKGFCILLRNNACPMAIKKVEDAMAEFIAEGEIVIEPNRDNLEAGKFQTILANKQLFERLIKNVWEEATEAARAGHKVPGMKLKKGKGKNEWADEAEADKFLTGQKLKKAERYPAKFITVSKARKELKEKLQVTKTANRFDELVKYTPGNPVLTYEDDSAEEWVPPIDTDSIIDELFDLDIGDIDDVEIELSDDIDDLLS